MFLVLLKLAFDWEAEAPELPLFFRFPKEFYFSSTHQMAEMYDSLLS